MTGQPALWGEGIEHGGTGTANPTYRDQVLKTHYNSGSVRFGGSEPNAEVGILPFLPMDLLSEKVLEGMVRRLYRHDAESFAWCLIYICICVGKDSNGRIGTLTPHPLSDWSATLDSCFFSKHMLIRDGLLDEFPLHQNIWRLVASLYLLWTDRFHDQLRHNRAYHCYLSMLAWVGERREDSQLLSLERLKPKKTEVQTTEPYKELPREEWFKEVFLLLCHNANVPESRVETFLEKVTLVTSLYPSFLAVEVKSERE